jgi:hypothetical protein
LRFARGIGLFLGFILELADVEILRNRGLRIGRHFDKVESNFRCPLNRFAGFHHAKVFALVVDNPDGVGIDQIVEARAAFDGRRGAARGCSYVKYS